MHVIVINLDYEFNSEAVCAQLWKKINEAIIAAGFRSQERSFYINLPENEANALARKTIDEIDKQQKINGKEIYYYLKCFYSFQMQYISNLLLPNSENIEVENDISML